MTKIKKLLSIVALAVFSLTFLVGCGLFVLNEERYRNQEVMTVGTEVITLGEVIDFFDTNGAAYLQQGQSAQDVWDALFPTFIQQKILISEYKLGFDANNANNSDLAKKYKNGEYLKDATIEYLRLAVYSSFYEALDELTMENLAADFNFADAETETREDKIDRGENWTPVDEDAYLDVKALEEKMEKYPEQDYNSLNYVFKEGDVKLQEIVDDLNERLKKDDDSDPDLTQADYIKAQNDAVSTTTRNLKNNRNMTMEDYFDHAVEEQILTRMANEYLFELYGDYMTQITVDMFTVRLENLKKQMEAEYAQDESAFASFITNLSDDSFVYCVPEKYQGEYHYVRSVLLPFSDEQSDLLTAAKSQYGANSNTYKNYRAQLANSIVIKDYSADDKGVDTTLDINALLDPSNPTFDGVSLSNVSKDKMVEWSYKYNTDPGMMNPTYGYVISKSSSNMTNSGETFVAEFVEGARRLANDPSLNSVAVITDYGVHIIYYDGAVEADEITWANRFNYGIEGGSASYRFYKSIYDEVKSLLADDEVDDLYKLYDKGDDSNRKIQINNKVLSGYTNSLGIKL